MRSELCTCGDALVTRVLRGGTLHAGSGINFPTSRCTLQALTAKDILDCAFALKQGVDMVALSFVRDGTDCKQLHHYIQQHHRSSHAPLVVAKIERREAVKHGTEIVNASDGIMVARGDLGIELRPEEVPLVQKRTIAACLQAAKPVIVATHMLESMTHDPTPTRAEVSDIANAVIDHTDAVMLSEETAVGAYPVEAVAMMARTVRATEASRYDDVILSPDLLRKRSALAPELSRFMPHIARLHMAKAIVVYDSLFHARLISSLRPQLPIVFATHHKALASQACLSWGLVPLVVGATSEHDAFSESMMYMLHHDMVTVGDQVCIVSHKESPRFIPVVL
jgi:pyruvate kinase